MRLPYPITFSPLLMERPWGGRHLETELQVSLPDSGLFGELWALVDRSEAQSIVKNGILQGKTLHQLWVEERETIFGRKHLSNTAPSFPLLCKILDTAQTLSLQVHPNATSALAFQGEPKTEFWYFLKTAPKALCYVGLKKGITRDAFMEALEKGEVEKTLHVLHTKSGDALFIPSGRLHALGAGNLVVEIQQNSDTTYRVFDWNRHHTGGITRPLHLHEAMASINFNDDQPQPQQDAVAVTSPFFHSEKWLLPTPQMVDTYDDFAIFTCLTGQVSCQGQTFYPGDFFLLPTSTEKMTLLPDMKETTLLCTRLPSL